MTLFDGRPEDTTGRLPREVRTYDYLDTLQIPYQRTDHERADNMEACYEIDAVLGVVICKNLFLCNRQKTKFYLLIMPGDKPFKTKELSKQLNISRLSFAEETYMEQFLDIHPGSVSVLGLMNDKDRRVSLVIDEDVLKEEMFGCHPCENTSSVRFSTEDLLKIILPALNVTFQTVHLEGKE
jgi:Ala-tRNA(Pro) deacylase